MSTSLEQLQKELVEEWENSKKLLQDIELARIKNELEAEKMKQQQWHIALQQLQETKEHTEQEHTKVLEELKGRAVASRENTSSQVLEWFNLQIAGMKITPPSSSEEERARQQKQKEIEEIKVQQEELNNRMAELQGLKASEQEDPQPATGAQETLIMQLRNALSGRKEEDPKKMLLKALITNQNKTTGGGGTSTLKPAILNSLLTSEGGNSMAEWLANLNRQEEGESEISKLLLTGEGEPKGKKARSGILDKATTNIQERQVWPQQNLGEDWVDEDTKFKHMKFEHLVAGETRTIETCTDPAQILGRLRLLR